MPAYTDGYTYGAVDQSAHTQVNTLMGHVESSGEGGWHEYYCFFKWDSANPPSINNYPYDTNSGLTGWHYYASELPQDLALVTNGQTAFGMYNGPQMPCDTTEYFRCAYTHPGGGSGVGAVLGFKTWAVNPTVGTPSLSGAQAHQVTVDGNWTPGTYETSVTVWVQYKRNTDPTWSTWDDAAGTGTGYTSRAITQTTVTGLDAATLYNFRLWVQRTNTANTTKDYFGSVASLGTIADAPSILTVAASGVGAHEAALNATVDPNGIAVRVRFLWDTASPPVAHETAWQDFSGDGDQNVQQVITGLPSLTKHYFQAFVQWPSPTFENELAG